MKFNDIILLCSLITAIIGLFFTFIQLYESNKINKSKFIDKMIHELRFNNDLSEAMKIVDYGIFCYDENFHESEIETKIDKLLSYLTYVCYMYDVKNIKNKEFTILKYEVNRVLRIPDIQKYLWNLYHFSKENKSECSFWYLIKYGLKYNLINEKFLNKDYYDEDSKMLNF